MNAQQHLGLDPHQRQQITAIYEDLEEQLHRMQRNTASQILKTLTPEQEAELRKDMDNPPQQRRQ
jgi:Spy/CpxP family protein refolding chaperone